MSFNLADYEPVEDRLRKFWERYPAGHIVTELLDHGDGEYVVMASAYRGDELRDGRPAATGLAHESLEQLPSNMRASALEVCETSAIGRALANLGFAPKGARPSREEMETKVSGTPHGGASVQGDAGGSDKGDGEAPADPPVPTPKPTHEAAWVDSPTLKKFQVCSVPDCVEHQPRRKADVA